MKHKPVLTLANQKGPLITLEQHNFRVAETYRLSGLPKKNGIGCPHCGAELIDSSPSIQIVTLPPQQHIHCDGCGFKGTRLAQ